VVAQVHTHGSSAFHSHTDDEGAIVQVPGFVSLVIPDFAMKRDPLARSFVAKLNSQGQFVPARLDQEIVFN
jgi:hypothetical protein